MALTKKQLAKEFEFYERTCAAEVDAWNRVNDDDLTIEEARSAGKLKNPSFDDYLDWKYPARVTARNKRVAQAKVRENFLSLSLTERLRYIAMKELVGVLRVHAQNLEEIEQALELEMEYEEGEGLF